MAISQAEGEVSALLHIRDKLELIEGACGCDMIRQNWLLVSASGKIATTNQHAQLGCVGGELQKGKEPY